MTVSNVLVQLSLTVTDNFGGSPTSGPKVVERPQVLSFSHRREEIRVTASGHRVGEQLPLERERPTGGHCGPRVA